MTVKRNGLGAACAALVVSALALGGSGCAGSVVKEDAWDTAVLERSGAEAESRRVEVGPAWLPRVSDDGPLTFVGLRQEGGLRHCLVVASDPAVGTLWLLPLAPGESPVTAATDPSRSAALLDARRRHRSAPGPEVVRLDWAQAVSGARLGLPVPAPRVVLAAAANYPSHLEHDLNIGDPNVRRDVLSAPPPRIFRKHPPTWPVGTEVIVDPPLRGLVGPFDPVRYLSTVRLPPSEEHPDGAWKRAWVDWEVELGVVIGRPLTLADLDRDPRAAWNAVAGFTLVSDTKTRNAPVFLNISNRGQPPAAEGEPYRFGDKSLDLALGNWGRDVCAWWSHAASCGDFTALGPFFVAHTPGAALPDVPLVTARTYAGTDVRGFDPGGEFPRDAFLLRQASLATERASHPERMIWGLDAIFRSILRGDGVLALPDGERRLMPGDVVALGTPGGVALTAKSQFVVTLLRVFLSTFTPIDWHDKFFDQAKEHYLHHGDQVFYWGEGLGYQQHLIERVETGHAPQEE